MSAIIVSQLLVYPVKSMRGLSLPVMRLTAMGPDGDRRWMVIDSDSHFITQREEPKLCLIETSLDNGRLTLSVGTHGSISLATGVQYTPCTVTVWADRVEAVDCGDQVADYLSNFLNRSCRLVYMPDSTLRQIDPAYAAVGESVSFADGFPILLLSEASLSDLNRRMHETVTMAHFRPNIVLSGCEPFAEDGWEMLQIGRLRFKRVKPCSRCVIPSINPQTAQKHSDVLKTLAAYRRRDGKIFFGQNVIQQGAGEIKLGDPLTVVA